MRLEGSRVFAGKRRRRLSSWFPGHISAWLLIIFTGYRLYSPKLCFDVKILKLVEFYWDSFFFWPEVAMKVRFRPGFGLL